MPRLTLSAVAAHKNATPLVVLTAYTAPVARLLDNIADILLVGDSLGMVVYGMEDTLGVTLEQMIWHGRAVVNASANALVVVDMPYGSYEASPELALQSARRLLAETGAQAVKLEGGVAMAGIIRHLATHDVPVMAHIGLLPQHVRDMGGYKIQGKTDEAAAQLLQDAQAIAEAGAFACVIEGVREKVARRITESIPIPTIGIGASAACDGQVLVIDDLLGLTERPAKFVRRYASFAQTIAQAAASYADDVRARRFPGADEVY